MKINIIDNKQMVKFGDLGQGECFVKDDLLFVKIESSTFNAHQINGYEVDEFDGETCVVPVKSITANV